MFAVKDNRSGMFLKAFNGSFNHAESETEWMMQKAISGNPDVFADQPKIAVADLHNAMFCLKTPNGAQIYKTEGAVKASIGDYDWLEIVPVKIVVDNKRKKK